MSDGSLFLLSLVILWAFFTLPFPSEFWSILFLPETQIRMQLAIEEQTFSPLKDEMTHVPLSCLLPDCLASPQDRDNDWSQRVAVARHC